jgi:DNA repair ATPase RecN
VLEELLEILLRPVTTRLEGLMATVEELNAKIDSLSAALDDAKTRITADVDELRRLLEGSVDPAQLDAVVARLDSITETVEAIDPDPDFPAPPAPTHPIAPTEG